MDDRFERFYTMIGGDAAAVIIGSRIAVIGVGGVGGGAVEALARSGVGEIILVDDDTVDPSNLNRQLVSLESVIGQYKTDVFLGRIKDINPECRVTSVHDRLTEDNVREFLEKTKPDYIADCIDDMKAKTALIRTAKEMDIPIISCMGAGNRMDPSKLEVTDIFKTSNDPVSRIMRQNMRKLGIKHLTVVASSEIPADCRIKNDKGGMSPGSSPFVPPCAGMLMASHIIKKLIEK